MNFIYYDLKQVNSGRIVEVTLTRVAIKLAQTVARAGSVKALRHKGLQNFSANSSANSNCLF